MHLFLEYLPLIIFFIVNKFSDFYWATGSLIVTTALQLSFYRFKKEKIPTRHWVIFSLVLVFGGLTIYLHDDAFIKWKVTVVYALFSVALLVSQLMFKKPIIKQMLGKEMILPDSVWNRLNSAWALFFIALGLLNLHVAFNMPQDVWVNFKVFWLLGLTLVFTVFSGLYLYKYLPKTENESEE